MKTYEIEVEETVLVTYWIDADSEEQAKALWISGEFDSWNRCATEQNDEIILITEHDLQTPNKQCENCDTGNDATHTVITLNGETHICEACHND